MAAEGIPRTRLGQLMRQRHMTLDDLRQVLRTATGLELSERQAYRWVNGEVKNLPYPHAQAALEEFFDESPSRLFGPPYGTGLVLPSRRHELSGLPRGHARDDWQGQVIATSAERARAFVTRSEATNVGTETLDQLTDDVRRLAVAYQQVPLASILADMGDTQERAFGLLEGRQRPAQTRDLFLLAGVASGLMARASHDLGAPHDAMTQARAAYTCADNAGHEGLKTWARGLQSLIAYWSGNYAESIRYARQGAENAARSRNTSAVWLAAGEARSLAAVNKFAEAQDAVDRAAEAREQVRPDDLDDLGGFCTFNRQRQLYYAAEALSWEGELNADRTERLALEAINAYEHAPVQERAFGDEAGTRCTLAIARLARGELDGAAAAMAAVFELPASQRTHGVVSAVENVERHITEITAAPRTMKELADAIHSFGTQRLALPL